MKPRIAAVFAFILAVGCTPGADESAIATSVASTVTARETADAPLQRTVVGPATEVPPTEAPPTLTPEPTTTLEPTQTPMPTDTPVPTPTPKPAAPDRTATPASPSASLLSSMRAMRRNIQLLANDNPDFIVCSRDIADSVPNNYEAILNYPTYNVSGSSAVVQSAYNGYRQALEIIRSTNRDLYQFCINFLAGTNTSNEIPFQIWGPARQGVNDALGILEPGIAALESAP